VKYEYPNLMLLYLESQASSCHCKYTRIIENHQRGTSVPDDMEQAHIKMNTSASLLFTIGIAFYCEMRRRMFTMGML
jgi:hypothetical protein